MDRKLRNRNRKRHSTGARCQWLNKAHHSRTATINIDECSFEIKPEVIGYLIGFAQHEGNELCGVLTGSQIGDRAFRVSKVSPPCVASNSRCGCVRDAEKANEFIANDYKDSERTRSYIGEWHTHPEPFPTPSETDYQSIIKNFETSKLVFPFLVMMIVGTENLYMWIYDGERFVRQELGQ